MTRAADATDACAASLTAITERGAPSASMPCLARHECRAATSALEVRGRATRDEHTAGLRWKPGEVGQPAQGLVLGERRAGTLEPRTSVDRRRADDEIEEHRRLGRCRGHEREEPRVVDRDRRRRERFGEHAERLRAPDPVRGDRSPGGGRELVGGSGAVEGRRIHPQPFECVFEDGPSERLRRLVEPVHGTLARLSRSER